MDTPKTENKVFIASQQIDRELAQIIQPQTLQLFIFYAQNYILVVTLQLASNLLTSATSQIFLHLLLSLSGNHHVC